MNSLAALHIRVLKSIIVLGDASEIHANIWGIRCSVRAGLAELPTSFKFNEIRTLQILISKSIFTDRISPAGGE